MRGAAGIGFFLLHVWRQVCVGYALQRKTFLALIFALKANLWHKALCCLRIPDFGK
jgi:hypothetical protein